MIKLADTLAPMSNDFYAVESENVGIDIDGTSKSIQQAYEDGDLSSGGSSIQVDTMPIASAENENMIVEFIGSTGTYVNGYFYECVSDGEPTPTYSWVQKNVQPSNATATDVSYDNTTSELVATNVQDAIDEIKGGLGTASGKNFTDLVRPNSHELVESGSVYSAINNALSSIYTPRGELTCAELTSSLLIEDNVGNIYTMSDSGTTSALFINGAGQTINVGDNVGIIKAGADTYLFNYMGNAFDLTDYQKKDLSSPIAGASTVEGAITQNTSDIEKIKAYTAVSNTDANTLTTTGLYYLTTGCTNIPSAYCILQVQSKNTTSISDDIAQYTVNTEGDQYYRVRVNGTWSSWQKLATTDSIYKTTSTNSLTSVGGNHWFIVDNLYPISGLQTATYIINGRNGGCYIMSCGTTDDANKVAPTITTISSGSNPLLGFNYDLATGKVELQSNQYNTLFITQISGVRNDFTIENETNTPQLSTVGVMESIATKDEIFHVGDRRNIIGWADLTSDVNVDGSSNYANNVGRIDGRNAMILVSNPTPSYQWPVTNSGDRNIFLDFGSYVQFFVDTVNNSLYVRSRDSVDMGNWGEIVTKNDLNAINLKVISSATDFDGFKDDIKTAIRGQVELGELNQNISGMLYGTWNMHTVFTGTYCIQVASKANKQIYGVADITYQNKQNNHYHTSFHLTTSPTADVVVDYN